MADKKQQGQDYFNIIEMSRGFRDWDRNKDMLEGQEQALFLWQARAEMAIAQQLSVISGHLSRLNQYILKSAADLNKQDEQSDHEELNEDE